MTAHQTVAVPAADRGGKFLTFYLADEEYGVAILKVQEIIGLQPITRVPRTPACIRGVIDLRGKVIPIMDLRERFGVAGAAPRSRTRRSRPRRASARACAPTICSASARPATA
jgi:purine-binding chemotaxis protein CheW